MAHVRAVGIRVGIGVSTHALLCGPGGYWRGVPIGRTDMILPCRNEDPEIFFRPETIRKAKNLCQQCPALEECYRMTRDLEQKLGRQDGVWAGMSMSERRRKWACVE